MRLKRRTHGGQTSITLTCAQGRDGGVVPARENFADTVVLVFACVFIRALLLACIEFDHEYAEH